MSGSVGCAATVLRGRRAMACRARGRVRAAGVPAGCTHSWRRQGHHAHTTSHVMTAMWLIVARALAQPRPWWPRRRTGRAVCSGSMGPLLVVVTRRWRGSTGPSGADPKQVTVRRRWGGSAPAPTPWQMLRCARASSGGLCRAGATACWSQHHAHHHLHAGGGHSGAVVYHPRSSASAQWCLHQPWQPRERRA